MAKDKLVVEVNDVSIRFNLEAERTDNLKEYFIKFVKKELLFQEFFALKNVNLQIRKGESWGFIGENGSGKSTLLKTISGILRPYTGSVAVHGKIAPLIELGAGFDKNLTARENIYMNGLVLGHSRSFMEEHFDEIVEFANIGKFLDSPIKNFSSGMKARLGFAIATIVDPDILIVDEVLEVGDYNFRKKCQEKMHSMLAGGTTLLFVSHNIETVKSMCRNAVWLQQGEVRMIGDSQTVCEAYRSEQEAKALKKKVDKRAKLKKKKVPYDYLVVGAGLFGAVFAHEMRKNGRRCLVIDKRKHVGGNVYTKETDGIHIHTYGAHIFHTSNEEVWKYVNGLVKFDAFVNAPIARYGDETYNLPFNMNTFHQLWGVNTPQEARERIRQQVEALKLENPKNLEEKALSLVGPDVYEKLIRGYTQKQWGRPCSELPAFIIQRLPLRFTYDNNYFNDPWQGIPCGGYTELIEKLLDDIDVQTGIDFKTYKKKNPKMFKRVVYTGMIDEYYDYQFGHLEYRSVRFETERLETESFQGSAVVNYTREDVPYTRIIEHKYFQPLRERKDPKPYTWISREYSQTWEPGMDPYYPVNDDKNTALLKKYQELAAKEETVIFGGRLGAYKYYNMDQVIAAALEAAEKEKSR